jgi:trehalose utilization protein
MDWNSKESKAQDEWASNPKVSSFAWYCAVCSWPFFPKSGLIFRRGQGVVFNKGLFFRRGHEAFSEIACFSEEVTKWVVGSRGRWLENEWSAKGGLGD